VQLLLSKYSDNYLTNGKFCAIILIQGKEIPKQNKGEMIMNVIGMALEELYRIFNILNEDKFDGELPEPVITIQKTKGRTLGHFTVDRVWVDKNNEESEEDSYYEINVDPR
jgi:hypothetical protein